MAKEKYTIEVRRVPTSMTNSIYLKTSRKKARKAVELFEKSECAGGKLRTDEDVDTRYNKWNGFMREEFGMTSRDGIIIQQVMNSEHEPVYKPESVFSHSGGIYDLIEDMLPEGVSVRT